MHGQEMSAAELEALIRQRGRIPRQRTTLYGPAPEERRRASHTPVAALPPAAE
jgi:FO synthase